MSKLMSKAVRSPKRAVKKLLLRKGASKPGLDDDDNLSIPFSPGLDLDGSARSGSAGDGSNSKFNFSLTALDTDFAKSGVSRSKRWNAAVSDDGSDDGSSSQRKPTSMRVRKTNKTAKRRGSGGALIGASEKIAEPTTTGYSSDGALSKKVKKEGRKERPQRPKKGTAKPARNNSDGTIKTKTKKVKSSNRSLDGNESDHSKKSIKSQKRNKKKAGGLDDGSGHSQKSSMSSKQPRSFRKKNSNGSLEDDDAYNSDHSKKSIKSTKKKKKAAASGDELDGSDHTATSTRSKKKDKAGNRGGKKLVSPGGKLKARSPKLSPNSSRKNLSPKTRKKLSLGEHIGAEMSAILADEHAFDGSAASTSFSAASVKSNDHNKSSSDEKADADDEKEDDERRNKMRGENGEGQGPGIVNRTSAVFAKLWSTGESARNLMSGDGSSPRHLDQQEIDEIASLKLQRAKEEFEKEMDERLAEIEEIERGLAEEHRDIQRDKADLAYERETLELRIEEEAEKNDALRRIIDTYEKKSADDEMYGDSTEDLKRKIENLQNDNDLLRAKIRSFEREMERKNDANNGQIIANQLKEIQRLRENASQDGIGKGSMSSSGTGGGAVDHLRKANESMEELLKIERRDNEAKLKSRDETIQFLMGELEKLKMSRGVISTESMHGGGEGEMGLRDDTGSGGWLGSVFSMSPGTLARKKMNVDADDM